MDNPSLYPLLVSGAVCVSALGPQLFFPLHVYSHYFDLGDLKPKNKFPEIYNNHFTCTIFDQDVIELYMFLSYCPQLIHLIYNLTSCGSQSLNFLL